MAAKNVDPLNDGVSLKSIEAGAQDWVWTCGVCHAGGGQMEYDRDRNDYALSTNSGDTSVVFYPGIQGATATPAVATGPMGGDNVGQMDCLMCHLDNSTTMPDYNGRAFYQTMGCDGVNFFGPLSDLNCDGDSLDAGESDMDGMAMTAGYYGALMGYDMFNRNFALKEYKLNLAASMGAGAVGILDPTTDKLTGIDWGTPTPTLDASQIAPTPKSANCAPCHARNDLTIGLPKMAFIKAGFGNYLLVEAPGTMVDQDERGPGDDQLNNDQWLDFGCKTGMGKRAHKIGVADPDGDNQFIPTGNAMHDMMDLMANIGASAVYTPGNLAGQPTGMPIPGQMPDIDVHDRAGMSCASCHYAVGSLDGGGNFDIAGKFCSDNDTVSCTSDADCTAGKCVDMMEMPAGEYHHLPFAAEKVGAMDHQFAQPDSYPDVKSKNNLDGAVSCESCHITKTHPRAAGAPTPLHIGLASVHLNKLACATCHIPEVYATPLRLKVRDWTAGIWKGAFRHAVDWDFNMVTGNMRPLPMMYQWLSKYGSTKLYPVLASAMPIFLEKASNSGQELGGTGDGDMVDAEGHAFPATVDIVAPVKHRDTQIAALQVAAAHPEYDIRINGGNKAPLFNNFVLVDSFEMDTAEEINAMITAFQGNGINAVKLKLFQTHFDATHGVVPTAWALGGSERGGCVSCHSSADPTSANYSVYSVGFFEGRVSPLNFAAPTMAAMGLPTSIAIGSYEAIKNPFALFADFDCTLMCNPATVMTQGWSVADAATFDPMTGAPVAGSGMMGTAVCDNMSPMHNMVDTNGNGDPTDEGLDAEVAMCVQMMQAVSNAAIAQPGFAESVGMNDGIAALQGFVVRENATEGCNPMVPGTCAPTDYFTRAEVRSHFKIDMQQTCTGAAESTCRVTWPIPGANYDAALVCQDQGVSNGNPFAPAVGPCCGVDHDCTTAADNVLGMDGKMHIVTRIPGAAMLGYTTTKLDELVSLGAAMGLTNEYNNNVHEPHVGNGFACTDCHLGAATNDYSIAPFDGSGNTGSGSTITYTRNHVGETGVATFAYDKVGDAPCTQWVVGNADGIPGTSDDYVCAAWGPAPILNPGTCATACHTPIVNPPAPVAPKVVAELAAVNDPNESFVVKVDAGNSYCEGASGCSYSFTTDGTVLANLGSYIYVQYPDVTTRTVSVVVTDIDSTDTDTVSVDVTPADYSDPQFDGTVTRTDNLDFTCTVTGTAQGANNPAVRGYIYWGNGKRSVFTKWDDLAAGIVSKGVCGTTVRVRLIDADYIATDVLLN